MSRRSSSTDAAEVAAATPPARASSFGLSVREVTLIALLSSFVVVAKWVLRMPINVSGHSGVLWIAAMIVGRGLMTRRFAATLIGVVGGLLVVIAVPASDGMLNWLKYISAGLVIDLCALVFGARFARIPYAMVAGALGHVAKLIADLLAGLAVGLPLAAIATGLTISAVSHAAFGALGGLIGALVLKALQRAGVRPVGPPPRGVSP